LALAPLCGIRVSGKTPRDLEPAQSAASISTQPHCWKQRRIAAAAPRVQRGRRAQRSLAKPSVAYVTRHSTRSFRNLSFKLVVVSRHQTMPRGPLCVERQTNRAAVRGGHASQRGSLPREL
jgi:hypothetical protein